MMRAHFLFVAALLAPATVRAQVRDTVTAPLTIGDAARLAAQRSATAVAARYRAEQADARVTQRRADLLPSLSGVALQSGRTFNTASFGLSLPGFDPDGEVLGPVRTTDVRGRASLTLLDFAALQRVRSSAALARASRSDAASIAEQVGAQAAIAYLRVQRAEAQIQARTADSLLAQQLVEIAGQQLKAGTGVGIDVTRAEAQRASVHAQLIQASAERDRARLDLLRLLGLPLSARVVLADSLSELALADTIPDEAAAVAHALAVRPDLQAIQRQLDASSRQVAAVRAERLPSLAVFGDQGITGKNPQHLLPTYDWGIQLSIPLFDGFRREGRVDEQRAVEHELQARRRDLQEQAAIDVHAAILDLMSAREQVVAVRERMRLVEQELSQARERFSAGVAGSSDVINASLALDASRNLLIDALTGHRLALVSLARAQGSVTTLR